jgi:hypothetical protein
VPCGTDNDDQEKTYHIEIKALFVCASAFELLKKLVDG